MQVHHDIMCKRAKAHFSKYTLNTELSQNQEGHLHSWMLRQPSGFDPLEIREVGFKSLLVHGACDPIVFGGYTDDTDHPLITLLGNPKTSIDYIAGKVFPCLPYTHDTGKALRDLAKLKEEAPIAGEEREVYLEQLDHLEALCVSEGCVRAQGYMYDHMQCDTEDIYDFGRVTAPPNLYRAVFAVRRLCEILQGTNP